MIVLHFSSQAKLIYLCSPRSIVFNTVDALRSKKNMKNMPVVCPINMITLFDNEFRTTINSFDGVTLIFSFVLNRFYYVFSGNINPISLIATFHWRDTF